ncbi:MAG: sulfatase-like hydrolase/transferase [Planctomycetota bacterium]
MIPRLKFTITALAINLLRFVTILCICWFSDEATATESLDRESDQLQRPNIVFILTDDQRQDSVGFMGNKLTKTPHLDRLASKGVIFENAYVTSAICTPSRACYMLGQYERRHGVNFNSGTAMSREAWAKSYPVILRNNGYVTGYVGKNHLPIGEKGYQTGLMENSFDYWYAGHHHLGFYPKEFHEIFDNAKSTTQPEIVTEGALGFIAPDSNDTFMQKANTFLKQRPKNKPFCLSICLNLPHSFSTSRMELRDSDDELYRSTYRDQLKTLPLVPNYIAKTDIRKPKIPSDVLLADLRQHGYDWVDQPDTARERMVRFMQAVTGIDRMVGRLCAELSASGLSENTVIIFASDHGLFMGEHGLGGKALCYETTLKIPFFIYDPRNQDGKRLSNLVLSIDVAPTILKLAGIEIPDSMQGDDLGRLLKDSSSNWREEAFGENLWSNIFGNPRCETVRTDQFRYIRYFQNDNREKRKRTPKALFYRVTDEIAEDYRIHLTSTIKGEQPVYEELFLTAKDPHETNNLVGQPEYFATLKKMRNKCQRLVAEAIGDIDTPPSTLTIDPRWTKTLYRQQN